MVCFFFLLIHCQAAFVKLLIRSEIYNCTFKNTNKVSIIGKCVTRVAKQDVINARGAMQVCAGGEAAIHAMRNIFEADETDAALLVDASNAFNSQKKTAALNNIRVLCPLITTYVINTYRVPARLFVVGGSELKSAEGTTQHCWMLHVAFCCMLLGVVAQSFRQQC